MSLPSTPQTTGPNPNQFRQPIGRGKPISNEFSHIENQIQSLQDNLRQLERLTRKIQTDQSFIQTEEEHLLTAFKQWLDVERKYDENDVFIDTISNAQQAIVNNHDDLLKFTNTQFIEPIKEYILLTGVVQDVLKRRTQLAENVITNNNEQIFDQLTIANETIKADIQQWNESKDRELIDLFYSIANKKIDFYTRSLNVWEEAAAKLTPTDNKK